MTRVHPCDTRILITRALGPSGTVLAEVRARVWVRPHAASGMVFELETALLEASILAGRRAGLTCKQLAAVAASTAAALARQAKQPPPRARP